MYHEDRETGAVASFSKEAEGYIAHIQNPLGRKVTFPKMIKQMQGSNGPREIREYGVEAQILMKNEPARQEVYSDRGEEPQREVRESCSICGTPSCSCDQSNQQHYLNYGDEGGHYQIDQDPMFKMGTQKERNSSSGLGSQFHGDDFWVPAPALSTEQRNLVGDHVDSRIMDVSMQPDACGYDLSLMGTRLEISQKSTPALTSQSVLAPRDLFNPGKETSEPGAQGAAMIDQWKSQQQPYASPEPDIYRRDRSRKMSHPHCAQDENFIMQSQIHNPDTIVTQQFFKQPEQKSRHCPSPVSTYFQSQDLAPTPEMRQQQTYNPLNHASKSQGQDDWAADDVKPPPRRLNSSSSGTLPYVDVCPIDEIPQIVNQDQFEPKPLASGDQISLNSFVCSSLEGNNATRQQLRQINNEPFPIRSRSSTPRPKLHVTIPCFPRIAHPHISSTDHTAPSTPIGYDTAADTSAYNPLLDLQPISAPLNLSHHKHQDFHRCASYSNFCYPSGSYFQTFPPANKPLSATAPCHFLVPSDPAQLSLKDTTAPPLVSDSPFLLNKNHFSSVSLPINPSPDLAHTFPRPPPTDSSQKVLQPGVTARPPATPRDPPDLDSLSVHQSEGFFRCKHPGCNKAFPKLYNLKSHVVCHSDSKPHKCIMCGKAFARKHDLQRHLRTIHSSERPFQCDACRSFFPGADVLRKHKLAERNSQSKLNIAKPLRPLSENGLIRQQPGCD